MIKGERQPEGPARAVRGGEAQPVRDRASESFAGDAEGLFRALTLRQVSRNKYFASFTYAGYRYVHRRYRVVRSLQAEADRLAGVPGSSCSVQLDEGMLQLRMESPRLQYRREVALLPYEWEWLEEQAGIRFLLAAAATQGTDSVGRLLP